jgi:hypothetical protein
MPTRTRKAVPPRASDLGRALDQCQPRKHRPLWIVLVRLRISEGAPHRIHRLFLDAEQETPLGSAWLTSSPLGVSESDGIPVIKQKIPLTGPSSPWE